MNACLSLRRRAMVLALGIFTLVLGPIGTRADVFVIDTNQSSLTLSGYAITLLSTASVVAQAPGSLTAVYGGSIEATQTANTIQFTGGSVIAAITNGSWVPLPGGILGASPADYAITFTNSPSSFVAAFRSFGLDVTSQVVTVTSGQFNTTNLAFLFPTNPISEYDYNESDFTMHVSNSVPVFSLITNKVPETATLVTVGGQQTLTMPVTLGGFVVPMFGNAPVFFLTGQIVAVRSASGPSPVTIQSVSVSNRVVTLEWQSTAGQDFDVLSSTNVINWKTNAMNVTSGTSAYSWKETNGAVMEFYRLAQ